MSAYDITGFLPTAYRPFAYCVPSKHPLNTAYQKGGCHPHNIVLKAFQKIHSFTLAVFVVFNWTAQQPRSSLCVKNTVYKMIVEKLHLLKADAASSMQVTPHCTCCLWAVVGGSGDCFNNVALNVLICLYKWELYKDDDCEQKSILFEEQKVIRFLYVAYIVSF